MTAALVWFSPFLLAMLALCIYAAATPRRSRARREHVDTATRALAEESTR